MSRGPVWTLGPGGKRQATNHQGRVFFLVWKSGKRRLNEILCLTRMCAVLVYKTTFLTLRSWSSFHTNYSLHYTCNSLDSLIKVKTLTWYRKKLRISTLTVQPDSRASSAVDPECACWVAAALSRKLAVYQQVVHDIFYIVWQKVAWSARIVTSQSFALSQSFWYAFLKYPITHDTTFPLI